MRGRSRSCPKHSATASTLPTGEQISHYLCTRCLGDVVDIDPQAETFVGGERAHPLKWRCVELQEIVKVGSICVRWRFKAASQPKVKRALISPRAWSLVSPPSVR